MGSQERFGLASGHSGNTSLLAHREAVAELLALGMAPGLGAVMPGDPVAVTAAGYGGERMTFEGWSLESWRTGVALLTTVTGGAVRFHHDHLQAIDDGPAGEVKP